MLASLRRGLVAGITVAALIFGLGIYPAAVTMAQTALTSAPPPAMPAIYFQPLIDTILPYIVAGLLSGFFAIAGWLARLLDKKWKLDAEARVREIEAKHRDSLHSAIYTSIANQVAQGRLGTLQVQVGSKALAEVTNYLLESTPDAMKRFAPTPDVLAQIATKAAVELQAKLAVPGLPIAGGELPGFKFPTIPSAKPGDTLVGRLEDLEKEPGFVMPPTRP